MMELLGHIGALAAICAGAFLLATAAAAGWHAGRVLGAWSFGPIRVSSTSTTASETTVKLDPALAAFLMEHRP